jgi:hypothetical protein
METCDYCGEYAKCKRIFGGHHYDFLSISGIGFDFICEKCNKAMEIINKQAMDKSAEQEKKEKIRWIKARDKLLKEI